MEAKNNEQADLNQKSFLFLSIGLAVSMLLVTSAFEWKSYDSEGSIVALEADEPAFDEIVTIPVTRMPSPPKPKVIPPEIIETKQEDVVEIQIDQPIPTFNFEEEPLAIVDNTPPLADEPVDVVESYVEQMPAPEGGMEAFYKYISKNLKYPKNAIRNNISGKVFVSFVVDKDGSLQEVQVIKGIGGGCDEEALRIVQNAKKWQPGRQGGRTVKVRMVIPITFQLSQ